MNIDTALAAATTRTEDMELDLEYSGMIHTHTYYGRGWVPSNAEQIGNVIRAYRFAKAQIGSGPVIFIVDEDALFAIPGVYDSSNRTGDSEGWPLDARKQFVDDFGCAEVHTETQALAAWWDYYARFDDENTPGLRDDIMAITGLGDADLEEGESLD